MKSSQTTRISTKLPESQQNTSKTTRILTKHLEKFANYQNLNKSTRIWTKHRWSMMKSSQTTRISTNQGVMGEALPHKPPRNHPESGGHRHHPETTQKPPRIRGSWGILPQIRGSWGRHSPNPKSGGHGGGTPPTHTSAHLHQPHTLLASTRKNTRPSTPLHERT